MTNEDNTENDLIIKPLKGLRGKPHELLKGNTIKAIVYFGPLHDGYSHPVLTLCVNKLICQGYDDREDKAMLHIKFLASSKAAHLQACRNDAYLSEGASEAFDKRKASGFLRGPVTTPVSTPFSGDIECRLDNQAYLAVGLTLIERAKEAVGYGNSDKAYDSKYRTKMHDKPELLKLIVGLRLIGASIVIKNGKVDALRRKHPEWSIA